MYSIMIHVYRCIVWDVVVFPGIVDSVTKLIYLLFDVCIMILSFTILHVS